MPMWINFGSNRAISCRFVPAGASDTGAACDRNGVLPVDLGGHDGDGSLINGRRVPLLDDAEIGLALLVALSRFPPLLAQEIRRRGQRVGLVVEIYPAVAIGIHAVFQRIARQELRVAQLAMLGAARRG